MKRVRGAVSVAAVVVLAALCSCSRATTPPVTVRAAARLADKPIQRLAVVPLEAGAKVKERAPQAADVVTELVRAAVARTARWTVPGEGESADATLTGKISEYREREGSDYGAHRGASVSIQLYLVPAGAKQPTWSADYSIEQQPLSDNLLNLWELLRGGPKWLTVAELTRIGVDEAVGRLAATAP